MPSNLSLQQGHPLSALRGAHLFIPLFSSCLLHSQTQPLPNDSFVQAGRLSPATDKPEGQDPLTDSQVSCSDQKPVAGWEAEPWDERRLGRAQHLPAMCEGCVG